MKPILTLTLERLPDSTAFELTEESKGMLDPYALPGWVLGQPGRVGLTADTWRELGCPDRLLVYVEPTR